MLSDEDQLCFQCMCRLDGLPKMGPCSCDCRNASHLQFHSAAKVWLRTFELLQQDQIASTLCMLEVSSLGPPLLYHDAMQSLEYQVLDPLQCKSWNRMHLHTGYACFLSSMFSPSMLMLFTTVTFFMPGMTAKLFARSERGRQGIQLIFIPTSLLSSE